MNENERFSMPLIFVHIPKTAGTSFRVSANNYFGEEHVLNDYGLDSDSTSQIVKKYYKTNKVEQLREDAKNYRMICGHYPLSRYDNVFSDSPKVTFVREPISRTISEYYHLKKRENYKGSLRDFYNNEIYCNRQVKLLGTESPEDLDFVGVTDLYESSLNIFNKKFNLKLHSLNINKGNYSKVGSENISENDIKTIAILNKMDINMYNKACKFIQINSINNN